MPYSFTKSHALFLRASESIAGGVNSGIRRLETPVPLFFEEGHGSRLWDVDGNEYIDFKLGQGALLYGHSPDGLVEALGRQARRGTHWAGQSMLEIEVAELLQSMVPSAERVRFNNSATEAAAAAFRVARALTGRDLILRFEGHYHGWSDEGLCGFATPPSAWDKDGRIPATHPSKGIIASVPDNFVISRWNDPDHLRSCVRAHRGRIAAIVFEPVMCNTGCIEPDPRLPGLLREICDRDGIVMIADETITGFRFGSGCAQAQYSLLPDLTVFGKAIGGGVPMAALAGTRQAMAPIVSGEVVHAGTLNGNPLCLAASHWCLSELRNLGSAHPGGIRNLGNRLMNGLAELGRSFDIPLYPQGPGIVFHTTLLRPGVESGPIRDYRDYVGRHDANRWTHLRRCLLEEGVSVVERGLWSLSLAHTESDVDEALQRARLAFERHASDWKAAS